MFKKSIVAMVLCLFMISLSGCIAGKPDEKYANMIMDPEDAFTDGTISITDGDGGTAYIFNVQGYKEGEYETYKDRCIELGFSQIKYDLVYEEGKNFGAYTEDGKYWIQINLDKINETIYVICKTSENYEK